MLFDVQRYPVEARRAFYVETAAAVAAEASAALAAAAASSGCIRQLVLLGVHAHNRFSTQVDGDASIAAVREVRACVGAAGNNNNNNVRSRRRLSREQQHVAPHYISVYSKWTLLFGRFSF